jgi:hypothetical protein
MSIYYADSHVALPTSTQINPRISLLPAEFNHPMTPISLNDLPGSQIPTSHSLIDMIFAPLKGEPMNIEVLDQDVLDSACVVGPGIVEGFDASLLDDNKERFDGGLIKGKSLLMRLLMSQRYAYLWVMEGLKRRPSQERRRGYVWRLILLGFRGKYLDK